jgi:hypothetical protein
MYDETSADRQATASGTPSDRADIVQNFYRLLRIERRLKSNVHALAVTGLSL